MADSKPIEMASIDEGDFLKTVNEDIRQADQALIAHGASYGAMAKGDKAVVTIKVAMKLDNPERGIYKLVASSTLTLPGRPPSETLATLEQNKETGELFIGVAASGSRVDSPRQATLATKDGVGLDPKTGQPSENLTLKFGTGG